MTLLTLLEVGADVVGVASGVCLLIPALRSNKLQEGVAVLEQQLELIREHTKGRPVGNTGPPPPAAEAAAPEEDAGVAIVGSSIKASETKSGAWSKGLSTLLRAGALLLILSFAMKLGFYALRP